MARPTERELQAARAWLRKQGVWVSMPTRLLALRIGARYRPERLELAVPVFVGVFFVSALGFLSVVTLLKGTHTGSGPLYTALIAGTSAAWFTVRRRERAIFDRLAAAPAPSLRQLDFAGPWYLGAAVVTFLGGAGLCAAMLATSPSYALSWLSLLVISAIAFAAILNGVLRAPVIAEDDASRAIDDVWRRQDLYTAAPALFVLPVLADLFEHRLPYGFTVPVIAYATAALGLQAVGALTHRRMNRALPPGNYGTPSIPPGISQRETNWVAPATEH